MDWRKTHFARARNTDVTRSHALVGRCSTNELAAYKLKIRRVLFSSVSQLGCSRSCGPRALGLEVATGHPNEQIQPT